MVNYKKGDFGGCDCSKGIHLSGDFGAGYGNTDETTTELPDYVSTAPASQPSNIIFYTALLLLGVIAIKKFRNV